MDTASTLFQTWHDSSTQLADAVQRYYDASLALENSVTTQSSRSLECGALDKLFAAIPAELKTLLPKMNAINRAGVALKRVINRNTKSVPIRTLPDDILLHIFLPLTRGQCHFFPTSDRKLDECHVTKATLAITHVCADWRRLATGTPSLWTHLDVVDRGYYITSGEGLTKSLKKLWLERASTTPLSLQISTSSSSRTYKSGELTELTRHFGNLRSLGIQAYSGTTNFAMLDYWMLNGGLGGSLEELLVAGRKGAQPDGPGLSIYRARMFLCSLRVLRVRHTLFPLDWAFTVRPPLVYLELIGIPSHANLSTAKIASLLEGCPELQVLKLEEIDSQASQVVLDGDSIRLDALERLELVTVPSELLLHLLRIIHPGPGELTLRLEAAIESSDTDTLCSFLAQTNVTKLYVKPLKNWAPLVDCLITIKKLRTLAIDLEHHRSSSENYDSIFKALLFSPEVDGSTNPMCRWPELHTLWLVDGRFSSGLVKETFQQYHIKNLILTLTSLWGDYKDEEAVREMMEKMTRENALPRIVMETWYDKC